MSQNKTVFPGLGQEGDFNPDRLFTDNGQSYSRSSNQGHNKGSVYPGMEAPNNVGCVDLKERQ